jgi:hypothetical protein
MPEKMTIRKRSKFEVEKKENLTRVLSFSHEKKKPEKTTSTKTSLPCPTLADQYLPMGATFSGMPQGPYSLLPESYSKKPGFWEVVFFFEGGGWELKKK